jgi:hypothetical protein
MTGSEIVTDMHKVMLATGNLSTLILSDPASPEYQQARAQLVAEGAPALDAMFKTVLPLVYSSLSGFLKAQEGTMIGAALDKFAEDAKAG